MIDELIKKHKLSIAFLGDVIVFFFSFVLVLYLRYGVENFSTQFQVHREPFIIIFILWFVIFYISNLYSYKAFYNNIEIVRGLTNTILINFFLTITIFYIFSRFFNLTPKVNLIAFTTVFSILDLSWRYVLRRIFIKENFQHSVLIVSNSPLVSMVIDHIKTNPQLGYSIFLFDSKMASLPETINRNYINMVVVDGESLKDNKITKTLYGLFQNQIEIMMFTDFYESLFNCIPLTEIEEEWFIKEITENKNIYESIKHLIEIILAAITIIIATPFTIIIGILIKTTSKGPVIFKQERIGKNNKPFIFYKFRTMVINNGPMFTTKKDSRITFIGKSLRYAHLDEIPQLINVLKGDISFIGPRPECTELVKKYENIPYYRIRHIIKPGITGWAQLNYKASISIEEAQKKFQFDLYYIKNRSLTLDLFILLKTIRTVFLTNN